MVIGLFIQAFADRVGRQKILLIGLIVDIVALIGLLSWNWYISVFFFFLSQVSNTLTISSTFIYITEMTTSEHRSRLFISLGLSYLVGFIYACIAGYFLLTPSLWRYTSVVMYVPCLAAVGLYCLWSR